MSERKIARSNRLVIVKDDQYTVGGEPLFQFRSSDHRTIYRDFRIDLSKNSVVELRALAQTLGIPSVAKMRKGELLQTIAPRIVFE